MKHKKLIICVAVVVAVLGIGHFTLDRIALNNLNKALGDIPGTEIKVGRVFISLIAGNLELHDVEFNVSDTSRFGHKVDGGVDLIKLEDLHWKTLFKGEARADRLLVRGPHASIVLDENVPQEKRDSARREAEASFFKDIFLDEVDVENCAVSVEGNTSSMKASVKDFSMAVHDICVSLPDGEVQYNDSTYSVAIDSLDFIDPQGLSRITLGHLATADAGAVEAIGLHAYNCVAQEQLAEKMGKVSVMWYDVMLDTLSTSAINIPRMVTEKKIDIESVHLSSSSMVLLQDDRYPPAVPYATIQEGLNTLEMPLNIKKIDGNVKLLTFIWETSHVNRGAFPLHNLRLALKSVSNAKGNVMNMNIRSGKKSGGSLNLTINVKNDKQETTKGTMIIENLEADTLDPFMRPLFGATAQADIHKIDCSFNGNKTKLDADFCMLYDNLSLKAWDDSSAPFKIVAQNSGLVTFLANIAVAKRNPYADGHNPKTVAFSVERDPMKPYPTYIIQCLTTGMLKTVLPGGSTVKK